MVRKSNNEGQDDLVTLLSQKVVGQQEAMKTIVPFIHMYQAGLAQEDRPAGVFLLLGPTGTGKTRTVEAIAEVLHGNAHHLLKVDCGEFQLEHEVAKLIGSPPGYVGHRETRPMLTQQQLNSASSPRCDLSLVLFDEIEKAAPSVTTLLLGILDKGIMRLADNSIVRFQKSLIFFTSNLGTREMAKEIQPHIGFRATASKERKDVVDKLESIALAAVRQQYSPEFVNRIDAVVIYQPLNAEALELILEQHIDELQKHVNTRLGVTLDVSAESRSFLLSKGTSEEYGARELKRTIHRYLTQPLATLVAGGQIEPGNCVRVEPDENKQNLTLSSVVQGPAIHASQRTILIVDDNRDLLLLLERLFAQAGWNMLIAESAQKARWIFEQQIPGTVLLDYMLGEEDGVKLGVELLAKCPDARVIIMTGGNLSPEEEIVCKEFGMPVLRKPFLANDVLNLIRARFSQKHRHESSGSFTADL